MEKNTRSLFLKARYLNEEYKEIKELFDKYYIEFFDSIKDHTGQVDAKDEGDKQGNGELSTEVNDGSFSNEEYVNNEEEPSEDKNNAIFLSKDLKKIYKKIMQITHPDKYPDYFEQKEKDKMLSIYTQCVSSINEDDLYSFLECASKLYIELPPLDDKISAKLEKNCNKTQNKINEIRTTYVWVWGIEDDNNRKEAVLNEFLKVKNIIN